MTDDFWSPARTALDRVPADPPGTETLPRRARRLRTRRYAIAGLVSVLVGAGLLFPLRILSRLDTQPERVGPAAPSLMPAAPSLMPDNPPPGNPDAPSFRPGWFTHVDAEDRVSIQAPRNWVYREEVTTSDGEPRVLIGLGPWNLPADWQGEACGYDAVLRFLPDDGVLVWFEELGFRATLLLDPLETPLELSRLVAGGSKCLPQQQVESTGFRFGDRSFLVAVAFGERAPRSLRETVEEVLKSFRARQSVEPGLIAEPVGAVVEVAKGTAFGQPWTLSAYWSGHGKKSSLCLQLTGAGGGCGAPSDAGPYPDSTFHATYRSFSTAPSPRSFAYGVVSKDIRGVTAILDDGRVLSVETIRTKKFPISFYVIAFKGETQVAGIEALDAEGEVVDESVYRP